MRNLRSALYTPANVPATNDEALLKHPTEDRWMTAEEMRFAQQVLLNAATEYFNDYRTKAHEAFRDVAGVYEVALRSK